MAQEKQGTRITAEGNENTSSAKGKENTTVRHRNVRYDEQNVNVVRINEEKQLLCKGKEKATYATDSKRARVGPLRDRNIGVVICDEGHNNVVHTNEETHTIEEMARKRKATHEGKENKNSRTQAGNVISNVALAQRARRERERPLKQSTANRLDQNLPRDYEMDNNVITTNKAQAGNVISTKALAQRAHRERERLLKQSTANRLDQCLPADCEPDNNAVTTNAAQAGNVISTKALAQCARRERERLLKQSTANRLNQCLPRDCEPDNNAITANEGCPNR